MTAAARHPGRVTQELISAVLGGEPLPRPMAELLDPAPPPTLEAEPKTDAEPDSRLSIWVGQRFGAVSVVELLHRDGMPLRYVRVRCTCGLESTAYIPKLPLRSETCGHLTPVLTRALTRDRTRSRRKREIRAVTVSVKRMTKRETQLGELLYPRTEHDFGEGRPLTRAGCASVPRPCPFVSCTHHLYLDTSATTGAIKLNFPDLEVWEMPASASCALDVADRGGTTLEEVGEIANLTRERVRQIEVKALAKIKASKAMGVLLDFAGEGPVGKRRLPMLQTTTDEDETDEVDAEGPASSDFDPDDEHVPNESGTFPCIEEDMP